MGNFFAVHPDGTALTQITDFTSTVISHKVGFSPDGLWVVFSKSAMNGYGDVFIAKADGSGLRRVTNAARGDPRLEPAMTAEQHDRSQILATGVECPAL